MLFSPNFYIVQGLNDGNEFFLFREISNNNYKEIKLSLLKDKLYCNFDLTVKELTYFKTYYLPVKFQIVVN